MSKNTVTNPRRAMIKQGLIFQLKLALDALRDILLSPVSIVLIIIDLMFNNQGKSSYFNQLMSLGRLSDVWINLFDDPNHQEKSVDVLIDKVVNKQSPNKKQ
jgi:hypothetical protein